MPEACTYLTSLARMTDPSADPGPMPDLAALVANGFTTSRADVSTWHRRLGHLHINSVLKMVRKGMVKGMEVIGTLRKPRIPCVPRLQGKQTRNVIAKNTTTEYPVLTTELMRTFRVPSRRRRSSVNATSTSSPRDTRTT